VAVGFCSWVLESSSYWETMFTVFGLFDALLAFETLSVYEAPLLSIFFLLFAPS